jgi:hypothetical protein
MGEWAFIMNTVNEMGRTSWARDVTRMSERWNANRVLVGNSEGKRPLGILRRRWEDDIKMDLREIGLKCCGLN